MDRLHSNIIVDRLQGSNFRRTKSGTVNLMSKCHSKAAWVQKITYQTSYHFKASSSSSSYSYVTSCQMMSCQTLLTWHGFNKLHFHILFSRESRGGTRASEGALEGLRQWMPKHQRLKWSLDVEHNAKNYHLDHCLILATDSSKQI